VSGDEAVLSALVAGLQDAWNRGDATAFAAAFAPDADFIHIFGHHGSGRAAIQAGHHAIFTTIYKGSTTRLDIEGLRFLASDVALLRLRADLRYTDGGIARHVVSRPSAIVTPHDGRWQVALFHNTLVISESEPDAVERLFGNHPHRDG